MKEQWTPDRIKKLREALGWSQEQLAKEVGYAGRSSISYLESGQKKPDGPALKNLEQLETRARRKGLLA